jgi:hypothetical protein
MTNRFFSGLQDVHIQKTILLLVVSLVLIGVSLLVGIGDNFPMIAMFFTGLITFFFALLRHWQKAAYFVVMAGIFTVMLIFVWIFKASLGEDIAMPAGLVSISGILAGIIGAYFFVSKE